MKLYKRYNENIFSRFLSFGMKTLSIYLLSFFIFISGQNISLGNIVQTTIDIENIADEDLKDVENSKIYITSGVSIFESSDGNLEIIQVDYGKGETVTKNNFTKNFKNKKTRTELIKHKIAHTRQNKEKDVVELFSPRSKPDISFSIQQNHNSAISQTQNPVPRNFLKATFACVQPSILVLSKIDTPLLLAKFISIIYSECNVVRPPPAFL